MTGGAEASSARTSSRFLRERGCPDPFRPAQHDYDLRREGDIVRLARSVAAGRHSSSRRRRRRIGANRENPGRFFYENLMMGVQLMEQSRMLGVAVRHRRDGIAPIQSSHRCRSGKKSSGAAIRRTNAPLRACEEDAAGAGPGSIDSSTASTRSTSLPVNLYGPRDNF